MDFFNMIYENYSGRKIEDVFKSYLILSLLVKQLLFSIFFAHGEQPILDKQRENNPYQFNEVTEQIPEEEPDRFQILLLVVNLLIIDTEKKSAEQKSQLYQ